MVRRAVRAGQQINLRVRFRDDLDDPAQASGVYVHIFEPEEEEFDLGDSYLTSGVPTYLGEGIFEYRFTPPGAGPDGIWYDMWEGILTGQPLEETLEFEVSASGVIDSLPETQLYDNNVVYVTIASGVAALDGTYLSSDYEFEFLTTTTPSYTNIRKVMLNIGGFIGTLEDDTIQTAILEASIEADTLSWVSTYTNESVYKHARREYVTCLASSLLLTNLGANSLRAKSLGDFSVQYDPGGLRDTMNRLQDCLEKWQSQLMTGGGAKTIRNPQYVVKGELDVDRPAIGRLWHSTDDGFASRRIPAGNNKEKEYSERRYKKSFRKRYW